MTAHIVLRQPVDPSAERTDHGAMAAGVLFRGARSRLLSAPAVSSRLLSTSAAVQEAVAPRVPLLIGGLSLIHI